MANFEDFILVNFPAAAGWDVCNDSVTLRKLATIVEQNIGEQVVLSELREFLKNSGYVCEKVGDEVVYLVM